MLGVAIAAHTATISKSNVLTSERQEIAGGRCDVQLLPAKCEENATVMCVASCNSNSFLYFYGQLIQKYVLVGSLAPLRS